MEHVFLFAACLFCHRHFGFFFLKLGMFRYFLCRGVIEMKIRYFLAVSVAACSLAGHVQAADVVESYEPPAPPIEATPIAIPPSFSWEGVYIGGQIGGAWSDSDVASRTPFVSRYSTDTSGVIGGLYAGYNFSLGGDLILSAETDFIWTALDDSVTTTVGGTDTQAKMDQKWAGATRMRAGLAMDRFLPYLAAGYAYTRIDSQVRPDASLPGFANSKTLSGWTVGVGADYAVLDNVLLRAEYRYSDYGDKVYDDGANSYKIDYKTNDLRVGVAYKF